MDTFNDTIGIARHYKSVRQTAWAEMRSFTRGDASITRDYVARWLRHRLRVGLCEEDPLHNTCRYLRAWPTPQPQPS